MAQPLSSVKLTLEPDAYLAGWRADASALFLPTFSRQRIGDEVAARVGLYGRNVSATVFGTVALVRRMGRPSMPPGVELVVHPTSLPAARFLELAARSETLAFHSRGPRWFAERDLIAIRDGLERTARMVNVSEGGCALVWGEPLPAIGEVLTFKLSDGMFGSRARGVVCWQDPDGRLDRRVGVRIIREPRTPWGWRRLVASLARSSGRVA